MTHSHDRALSAIDDHLGFQQRLWRLQRLGWAALVAWLVASAVGATGPGRCSHERVEQGDAAVEYDRWIHLDAPTLLVLSLESGGPTTLEVALEGRPLDAFDLSSAIPSPQAESVGARERRLSFAVAEPGRVRIELRVVPRRSGWKTTNLRIGEAVFALRQFVFP